MSENEFFYVPRETETSPWQLEILGAGMTDVQPNQPYPPKGHPKEYEFDWEHGRTLGGFQMLYITRGSGEFETKYTPLQRVDAPFLFLLFPNIWHRYRPGFDQGWQEHWIGFDGDIPRGLLKSGLISSEAPFFEIGHHSGILTHFQLVLDEVRDEALGFRRVAATSVLQILALATSLPLRQVEENQPLRSVVRRATFLLRERVDEVLSVEKLADELSVGYTFFRRKFKQFTGFSPKQYHSSLRFERVKRLLKETNLTIGEIAVMLNFDSTFHLSEWFKKRSGSSPLKWKRNDQNK